MEEKGSWPRPDIEQKLYGEIPATAAELSQEKLDVKKLASF